MSRIPRSKQARKANTKAHAAAHHGRKAAGKLFLKSNNSHPLLIWI
jgi:hypothetical protein